MQLPEWSSGIGKHMLKVEDGKFAVGNFRGQVVKFYQHWAGGRSSVCPGRETCPMCNSANQDDHKASGRFRVNFVTKNGALEAKIFEGGKRVYEQLLQINKDVPLEKAWVKISRIGTKKETQYMLSVIPGDGGIVKPTDEKELLKVQLHDVSVTKPEEEEGDDSDLPF